MEAFREPVPSRPRWQRLLPWFAGLVLLAGVAAALVKLVPNTSGSNDRSATPNPTIVPRTPPKTVPLAKEARLVAGRFILTAVQRTKLAEAWEISGPQIRQGMTKRQFLTGNIAVVPYPYKIGVTPMKVDYSFKNHALLEVALIPANKSKAKIEYFFLELRRQITGQKGHWLVWSWVPNAPAAIPATATP